MQIIKSDWLLISAILILIAMALAASATERQSSANDFYPDYPVGTSPIRGGTGYVTNTNDGDGWKLDQDFGEYNDGYKGYHTGEDWNDERGGNSELTKEEGKIPDQAYAIAGGTIVDIKSNVGKDDDHYLGGGIVIEHILPGGEKEKIYSVYVHIVTASGLKKGDFVGQGDPIGTFADISSSDLSSHLHFEIRTKWDEGQKWWPHANEWGYYPSKEDLISDGLIDPSNFIDSRRWYSNGSNLYDQNKYEKAIECFSRAIEVDQEYADAWCEKGNAFFMLGDQEEAIQCYDEAIKINPKYEEAWNNKGTVLHLQRNYDEAIQCYDEAIKINPKYEEAWYGKGHTLYEKGDDYDEALQCINEAITLNPGIPEFWKSKGDILKALGSEDAQVAFNKADELNNINTPTQKADGAVSYD